MGWGGFCQSSLCLLGPTARNLPRWLPELPEETKERGCHLVEESDRTAHWLSAWWIPPMSDLVITTAQRGRCTQGPPGT